MRFNLGLERVLTLSFLHKASFRPHIHHAKRFTRVFWVESANLDTIEQSYTDIATTRRPEAADAAGGNGRKGGECRSVHEVLALLASLDEE